MSRNIFHIGFFHSASKLLQTKIFPEIKGYNNPSFDINLIEKSMSKMPKNFGKYFYYEKNNIYKEFEKYKKPFIYSSEAFSHLLEHNSYYKIKPGNENTFIGLLNLSRYIQSRNAHLLFIIRKQSSVINSYYKRWAHFYKDESELFIDFPYEKKKHKSIRTLKYTKFGMIYLNTFNYRLSLSPIFNFVDSKKIHIIPYEYLLTDKKKFLKLLGRVFKRNLNFLLPKLETKINSSSDYSKKELSAQFKLKIQKEFEYDNRLLDKKFKLNLKNLGYY